MSVSAAAVRSFGPAAVALFPSTFAFDALAPNLHTQITPIYVRGEAYLAARRGAEAAIEFQRILDHRALLSFNL
jgi:hypothetical protein